MIPLLIVEAEFTPNCRMTDKAWTVVLADMLYFFLSMPDESLAAEN